MINHFKESITKAEKAAAHASDKYKEQAFSVVLSHLLSQSESKSSKSKSSAGAESQTTKQAPERTKGTPKFSAADFEDIIEVLQKTKETLSGREVGALIASKFENQRASHIQRADLESVYKKLIRSSKKVPVIKDYKSLMKDMCDELYLDRVSRGKYVLSDVGVRRVMELKNAT